MLKKLFSTDAKPGAYFRCIDWTSFWAATAIAFIVYFFTLGPSVGLEDSGELATAGAHLGVPHPPGYPFWTLCSWIFCKIFAFVTYQGHPTPAWAISCLSAVFGALAAGCTAMLITRSGSDMLDSLPDDKASDDPEVAKRRHALMALAGGLGGSLIFAFSPVEWSQATIVEVYSLNAFFLMAVFLLSYRWMRQPSDKILLLTAFVFGLGLTNYQVLLLAAVPLAIIIAVRNLRLFRDFILICIPVGLTSIVLKIGSMLRANAHMTAEVINKFEPVTKTDSCPNEILLWSACILLIVAPILGAIIARRGDNAAAKKTSFIIGFTGVGLLFLSATVFASAQTWTGMDVIVAPLLEPSKYAIIGTLLAGSFICSLGAVFAPKDDTIRSKSIWMWLAAAGVCAFIAISYVAGIKAAGDAGYAGEVFAWTKPTLLLLAGVIALFALVITTPRGLAFAIPVAAVQITVFILLRKGAMNGLTNPHSWWFIWPIIWNFMILALAYVALPNGKSIAPATLFAELGVSFYVYMPIVSDLRNPPMNWGYPRTWEGFKHAITRGQYEAIGMTDVFSSKFAQQMGFYFQDLRMQFTLVAATLALIPFTMWKFTLRTAKKIFNIRGVYIASALYVITTILVIESEFRQGEPWGRVDKYLIALLGLLVLIGLVSILVKQAIVVSKAIIKHDSVTDADTVEASEKKISLSFMADNISQQWLIASGACFAMMSVLLVALANVKGDIQDGFIQKVKFISSHGMFSLWIGYGLVFGLLVANKLVKYFVKSKFVRKVAFCVLAVAASLTCAIPVYENYTNDKLVFAMGSAEQNGHTFGWQFGAYQLEGANSIRNELDANEEPLPNPQWPEPMEQSAIFFGGTDPGRFVPTYMIYAADFRPDVYLITQNALADDTYMSVERDLYGDEIWIPSKEDSAESFNIYVNEVQSGKRQANGDLRIENGRVQVTGALGVMEINGILTKMMFDHERLRHAFYVEESYVIQWMYPYLTPHGLIMKINANQNSFTPEIIRNDMEFWDWYTRRLLNDPAFRRDFPAQKSFSKLRAAIAGLYSRTGRINEADQSFREACLLYPASPEASFRYIQELLLPMNKWNIVYDILDYTDRVDPNSGRTGQMRGYVKRLQDVTADIKRLQSKAVKEGLSINESFQLAQCLNSVGQNAAASTYVRKALTMPGADSFNVLFSAARLFAMNGQRGDAANAIKKALPKMPKNLDGRTLMVIATMLAEGGMYNEASQCLNDYLRTNPKDADAWLTLAVVKDALGQTQDSLNAIRQAYTANANVAAQRLQSDQNLQRIAAPLFKRR